MKIKIKNIFITFLYLLTIETIIFSDKRAVAQSNNKILVFLSLTSQSSVKSKDKSKYGFINSKGEILVEPKFDTVSKFSNGLALVKVNNKYGFINRQGKQVIYTLFDTATPFVEGLSFVSIGDRYSFIARKRFRGDRIASTSRSKLFSIS